MFNFFQRQTKQQFVLNLCEFSQQPKKITENYKKTVSLIFLELEKKSIIGDSYALQFIYSFIAFNQPWCGSCHRALDNWIITVFKREIKGEKIKNLKTEQSRQVFFQFMQIDMVQLLSILKKSFKSSDSKLKTVVFFAKQNLLNKFKMSSKMRLLIK